MDAISAWIGWISLVVAFVSLYRTRKSGEQQQQLDQTKMELARQANEMQALHADIAKNQLKLNERVIASQSPAVIKVSTIQEAGTYYFHFLNTGLGEATDIYFEVVDHPNGHIHKPLNHTHGVKFERLAPGAQEKIPLKVQEPQLYHAQLSWSDPDGTEKKIKVDVTMKAST